jgi:hypothetical protein
MVFYSFFYLNQAIIHGNLCILNCFNLNLISNLIFKLEIKFLDNLNKIIVWKSVYVLSFFINAIPKFLFLKIDRLHKDSFYNLLIYFYIPKKVIYL